MPDTTALGNTARREESRRSQIASRALDDAKQMGNELLAAACDSVTALADEQRNRAADQIAAVGDALRLSAVSLDRETALPLGRYAGDAAAQLGDFAQTVRNRSWSQLAADAEDFARAWPLAFVASALGVGFLAGRFLFAAAPRPPEQPMPQSTTSQHADGQEPRGGARRGNGAVSGEVSGNARAGDGPSREVR